jgi:hypothetical protein
MTVRWSTTANDIQSNATTTTTAPVNRMRTFSATAAGAACTAAWSAKSSLQTEAALKANALAFQ